MIGCVINNFHVLRHAEYSHTLIRAYAPQILNPSQKICEIPKQGNINGLFPDFFSLTCQRKPFVTLEMDYGNRSMLELCDL